jgi:hypothetical protein
MGGIAHRKWLVAVILVLAFSAGWAQEKPAQQKPKSQKPTSEKPTDTRVGSPTAPLPPLSTATEKKQRPTAGQSTTPDRSASSKRDQQPLTGAEQFTLSTMGRGHSYFIPLFQVAESGDTNIQNEYGSSQFQSVSTISGAFTLNHVWSRYNFSANYAGSGFLYNRDLSMSSSAHAFSLSQTILGARSSFLLADSLSYLPESSFGYARFGALGNYGGGLGGLVSTNGSGLSGMYIPNQSVLTGDSTRISNSVVGQYNYNLSPLSSLTFIGSYGLLRFPNSDFIDSNAGIFGMGYNHAVSRKDTIGLTYFGTIYRYDQSFNNFTNHAVAFMYGHKISQLLFVRLGAGPQVNTFGAGSNLNTMVSWFATAALGYTLVRTRLGLWYEHYTTAGSGVFNGAETDRITLDVARQFTRKWDGSVGLGYSYNKTLQSTATSPTFNAWYASANLRRTLGPYMGLFLSYNLQQQTSNNPFCIGSGCGSFYTRNYFSIGLNWHPRAVELGRE